MRSGEGVNLFDYEEDVIDEPKKQVHRRLDWKEIERDGKEPDLDEVGGDVAYDENGEELYYDDLSDSEVQLSAWDALQMRRMEMFAMDDSNESDNRENSLSMKRQWTTSFTITQFFNSSEDSHDFFLVIRFGHANKQKTNMKGKLKTRHMYTNVYHIRPRETYVLKKPINVWRDKTLTLSCLDLKLFTVELQMWTIRSYTFNEMVCSQEMSLAQILEQDAIAKIELTHSEVGKRGKVHKVVLMTVSVFLSLAEVYLFDCKLRDWQVDIPAFRDRELEFEVPITRTKRVRYRLKGRKSFGPKAGTRFYFTGSNQSFENNYIRVNLLEKGFDFFRGPQSLGSAVIPLKGVQTIPDLKGMLKKLSVDPDDVICGIVRGKLIISRMTQYGSKVSEHGVLQQPNHSGVSMSGDELDENLHYLVVKINSVKKIKWRAGGLNCNPFVQVLWDNYTMRTQVQEATVQPKFKETLHLPLHLIDQKMELTNDDYVQFCLPIDIQTKGPLLFELWHQESTSQELIAAGQIDLSCLTLPDVTIADRSLLEEVEIQEHHSQGKPTEEETDYVPFYLRKKPVRVYRNEDFQLDHVNETSTSRETCSLSFEIFFFPPLPENLIIPKTSAEMNNVIYKQIRKRWERDWSLWKASYREWYPQSPNERRWHSTATTLQRIYPLPAFLSPSPPPLGILSPGELTHWIANCIGWTIAGALPEPGLAGGSSGAVYPAYIDWWNTPNHTLNVKKGTTQDHALLLCSFLLGMGYDAYVAVGSIRHSSYVEHAWVITREAGQYVIMWDCLLRQCFVMPQRYGITHRISQEATDYDPEVLAGGVTETSADHPYFNGQFLTDCYNKIAKASGAPLIQYPFTKQTDDDEASGTIDVSDVEEMSREEVLKLLGRECFREIQPLLSSEQANRLNAAKTDLTVAPVRELCTPELAAWLPYSTIEVIFNNEQLWGNMQNADPSAIYYDVESPYQWRPLLTSEHAVQPIDKDLYISATTIDTDTMAVDLQTDISELIQMSRNNVGLSTHFENEESLVQHFNKYLELMEYRSRLDTRCDPGKQAGDSKGDNDLETGDSKMQLTVGAKSGLGAKAAANRSASEAAVWTGIAASLKPRTEGHPDGETLQVLSSLRRRTKQQTLPHRPADKRKDEVLIQIKCETGSHGMLNPIERYTDDEEEEQSGALGDLGAPQDNERKLEGMTEEEFNEELLRQAREELAKGGEAAAVSQPEGGQVRMSVREDTDKPNAPELYTGLASTEMPWIHKFDFSQDESDAEHYKNEVSKWINYYNLETAFEIWRKKNLEIKDNYTFCGMPIHLSTGEDMRQKLLSSARLSPIVHMKPKGTLFTITAKCFPIVGGVVSTWLFIGVMVPWGSRN